MKTFLRLFLCCILGMGGAAAAAFPALAQSQETPQSQEDLKKIALDPGQMLPESLESQFKNIRTDPDPEQLVRNAHYWVSNENAHYVWYPYIKDMGGILSGVGTDQVYLLAGWANAAIVLPMDFDRAVKNLHIAYGAAFLSCDSIDCFKKFWFKSNAENAKKVIEQYFPENADDAFKAWKSGRAEVSARISRVVKKYTQTEGVNVPTFLTDNAQYQRIRTLWQNHRVFPICGDLTGDNAMTDIAKILSNAGLSLSILYPSNAEHYFKYGPAYRRNIINMPFDGNSLILRTRQMRSLGLAEEEDYHYNMQSGQNFKLWLQTTRIPDQHSMLRKRSKTQTSGLSILSYEPSPSKVPPEIAPVR